MNIRTLIASGLVAITVSACVSTSKSTDMGFQALNNGSLDVAENHLLTAIKTNPDDPYANLNLGAVYHKSGNYDLARAYYMKTIRLNPDFIPSKATVGMEGKTVVQIARSNLAALPSKNIASGR